MKKFSAAPTEMFASLLRNREIIGILARRAVLERYRGTVLGVFWSFAQPMMMLAIYTVFFGNIMGARWGARPDSTSEFALVLFAGLIPFNLLSDCMNASPNLIRGNVAYVKKIVFPLETLPAVALAGALFQAAVSTLAWLGAFVLLHGAPPATLLWLPVLYLPLVVLVMGISWLLAVLGAYFRDISHVTGIVATMFLFFSPIFYSLETVPEQFRPWMRLNPLSGIIDNMRRAMYWGRHPDYWSFAVSLAISLAVAWAGFAVFQRMRREFADGI